MATTETLFEMSAPQAAFDFPQSLTEKYRPKTVDEFVGLDKVKKVMRKLIAKPFDSAWLFIGPPGTGKTCMGLAIAAAIPAELPRVSRRQEARERHAPGPQTLGNEVPFAARHARQQRQQHGLSEADRGRVWNPDASERPARRSSVTMRSIAVVAEARSVRGMISENSSPANRAGVSISRV